MQLIEQLIALPSEFNSRLIIFFIISFILLHYIFGGPLNPGARGKLPLLPPPLNGPVQSPPPINAVATALRVYFLSIFIVNDTVSSNNK